jgi:2-keto-4-pentenoate hydratase/2-oxohepta-3-ene-1,7-dioic acid hydratase in catechol pathway
MGVLRPKGVQDVTDLFEKNFTWPSSPGDPIVRQLARVTQILRDRGTTVDLLKLDDIRLDAPVAAPSKIIGAPVNYKAHIDEANADAAINTGKTYTTLEAYGLFLKANSSLAGPSDDLVLTFPERRTDNEVELAVVIGKDAKNVPESDALSIVAGYTIGLDLTIRGGEAPSYRKSPDGYCIVGPCLVTPDELPEPGNLRLQLSVNGEMRQDAMTAQLIFDVPRLIAYASRIYTLHPGDIILTGTPAGVGPVRAGDRLWAAVEGIGELNINARS